jgi:glycoprotein 3-alpha-L-fucosyltransferase
VVVGAPNILEFAPYPDAVLHIKELKDVESIAATMKHLASNSNAFNKTLRFGALLHFMLFIIRLDCI